MWCGWIFKTCTLQLARTVKCLRNRLDKVSLLKRQNVGFVSREPLTVEINPRQQNKSAIEFFSLVVIVGLWAYSAECDGDYAGGWLAESGMTRWSRDDSDGILKSVDDSQPSSSHRAGARWKHETLKKLVTEKQCEWSGEARAYFKQTKKTPQTPLLQSKHFVTTLGDYDWPVKIILGRFSFVNLQRIRWGSRRWSWRRRSRRTSAWGPGRWGIRLLIPITTIPKHNK